MSFRQCVRGCLKDYGYEVDLKAITIIIACILAAIALGDFSLTSLAICLAAGGVADVTVGLSACIYKCVRNKKRFE